MLGYIFAIVGVVVLLLLALAIKGPAKKQGLHDAERPRPDERAGTSRSKPSAEQPGEPPVHSINHPHPSR